MPGVVQHGFDPGFVKDDGQDDTDCVGEDDGRDQENIVDAPPDERAPPDHHQPERHHDHRLELLDAAACVRDGDVKPLEADRRHVVFDLHPEHLEESDRQDCGDHSEWIAQVKHDRFAERRHEEAAEQGDRAVKHRPHAAEKADRPERQEEPCAVLEARCAV